MPTYEYKCRQCHTRLEAVQAFSDSPLTECPSCGGPLRKVFSTVGVVFKGSGFYRNDSRTASANGKADEAAAKAESSSAGKADAKADSKSESKADAKSDGKSTGSSDAKSGAASGAKSDGRSAAKPASKAESSTASKSA